MVKRRPVYFYAGTRAGTEIPKNDDSFGDVSLWPEGRHASIAAVTERVTNDVTRVGPFMRVH